MDSLPPCPYGPWPDAQHFSRPIFRLREVVSDCDFCQQKVEHDCSRKWEKTFVGDSFGDGKWIDPTAPRPCWEWCECRFNIYASEAFDPVVERRFDFVVEKNNSEMLVKIYSPKLKREIARLLEENESQDEALVCNGFRLLRSYTNIVQRVEQLSLENGHSDSLALLQVLLEGLLCDRQIFQSFGLERLYQEGHLPWELWLLYQEKRLRDVFDLMDDSMVFDDPKSHCGEQPTATLNDQQEHSSHSPELYHDDDELPKSLPYFGSTGPHKAGCSGSFGSKWMRILWQMNQTERQHLFNTFGIWTIYDSPSAAVDTSCIIQSYSFCQTLCHLPPETAFRRCLHMKKIETARAILSSTAHCRSPECFTTDTTLLNVDDDFWILADAASCGDDIILDQLLRHGKHASTLASADHSLDLTMRTAGMHIVPPPASHSTVEHPRISTNTGPRNSARRPSFLMRSNRAQKISELQHWFLVELRRLLAYDRKRVAEAEWIEQRIAQETYGESEYSEQLVNLQLRFFSLHHFDRNPKVAWKTGKDTLKRLCRGSLPRDLNEVLMFLLIARAMSVVSDSHCSTSLVCSCSCCMFSEDLRRWQILFVDEPILLNTFREAVKDLWNIDLFHSPIPKIPAGDQLDQFLHITSRIVGNMGQALELVDAENGTFLQVQNSWKTRTKTNNSIIHDEPLGFGRTVQAFHHPEYGSNIHDPGPDIEHISHMSSTRLDNVSISSIQTLVVLIGGAIFATVIAFVLGQYSAMLLELDHGKLTELSTALRLSWIGRQQAAASIPSFPDLHQRTRVQTILDVTLESVRLGLERESKIVHFELPYTSETICRRLGDVISNHAPATLDNVKTLMKANDGQCFEVGSLCQAESNRANDLAEQWLDDSRSGIFGAPLAGLLYPVQLSFPRSSSGIVLDSKRLAHSFANGN